MKTTKNEKEILQTIGSNIRRYRIVKGWSQEEFAHECELHRTYIGSIERGERNITILNLIKIKERLEVRLDELYPE